MGGSLLLDGYGMSGKLQYNRTCTCVWPQRRLPALAGKSTLLDLIAGRKTIGELHGDILFSGIRPTQAFLRRYTGAPPLQLFPGRSRQNC